MQTLFEKTSSSKSIMTPLKTRKVSKIERKNVSNSKKNRFLLLKYIDQFQNFLLFGDFVLPGKLMELREKPYYYFKLFKDYKYIQQIHVREEGIILDFEDFSNENSVCSLPLIKQRLQTLGDKDAKEFFVWLEKYCEIFPKINTTYKKNEIFKISSNAETFAWIDNVFESHKNDGVIIVGRKIVKNDFKYKYIGYNKKILEFITKDDIENVLSDDLIEKCLKIFVFYKFEDLTNIIKGILSKKEFPMRLNTFIGELNVTLQMSSY